MKTIFTKTDSRFDPYKEQIKKELSEKRLAHTLSVADDCIRFAEYFKLSEEEKADLYISALLHDITKEKPPAFHFELLSEYGVEVTADEKESIQILHAVTGALYSKKLFGISDNIFSAIDAHTTGKENMSVTDKLLFLCDFIEPTRTHEACRLQRESFLSALRTFPPAEALDRAVLESLDSTIIHLVKIARPIALRTIRARNFLIAEKTNGKDKSVI